MSKHEYPPCVGCGYCCQKVPCVIGVLTYDLTHEQFLLGGCPGLYKNDIGQYRCRLAVAYKDRLAIGAGCSSPLLNTHREKMIKHLEEVCDAPEE